MPKKVLYCRSHEGRFKFEKPYDIKNLPGKFKEGKRLKVTFEDYVPMKNRKQLGYYRAGILPYLIKQLADETGITTEAEWHEQCKANCGMWIEREGLKPVTKSQADYTEPEMAVFITRVQAWVADFFGVTVPPPTVIDDYI